MKAYALVAGGWHWFPYRFDQGQTRMSSCGRYRAAEAQLVAEPEAPLLCPSCRFDAPRPSVPAEDMPRVDLSPIYWRPLAKALTSRGRSRLHYSPEDTPGDLSACGQQLVALADSWRVQPLPVLCAHCARSALWHYRVPTESLAGWPVL